MINIKKLDFAYGKNENLFANLNLNLSRGNIYGLLGKNGAGKTTLLKIIIGLLFPGRGECKVLDYDSKERSPELLSEIYFIAEEFFTPALSIKEYVRLYGPFYPRFDRRALSTYLNNFSLSEKSKLTRLSYGQKKKFLIAFGLAANTRLLIMDEPTNGLDIPGTSQFRKLLVSSVNEDRITLISTHQVRDIQNLIDPVFILDAGEIIFHQSMEDVNKKLSVQLLAGEPEPGSSLFYEKVLGGYAALCEDGSGESNVDLEILFNAVVNNKEKFSSLFASENNLMKEEAE